MAQARLVYHPVLTNKRSRIIFWWFFVIAVSLGSALWTQFLKTMSILGINTLFGAPSGNWVTTLLMSWYFHVGIILGAAVIGAGITAQHVVGPVKRIEDWLLDHEAGRNLKPLKVRDGDKFSRLVELINQLSSK